jgi:hypothetical protein
MNIKGIKGLTIAQIQDEVAAGGKFVHFSWCVSLIVFTFRQRSATFFIKSNEAAFVKSLPYTLVSFLLGWWGIPWGFIYTPACLYTNLKGGKNVTAEMMNVLHRHTNGHVFEFEKEESSLFYHN